MEWQGAIRGVFSPSGADPGAQAQFNELVIKTVESVASEVDALPKERWVNWLTLSHDRKWALRDTPLGVERTIEYLVKCGQFIRMKESERGKRRVVKHWVRPVVAGNTGITGKASGEPQSSPQGV